MARSPRALPSGDAANCIDKAAIDRLLESASGMNADIRSLFIPISQFSSLANSKAAWLADEVFEKVIFPGFQCHLTRSAAGFAEWTDSITSGAGAEFDEATYFRYLDDARSLWVAANDFQAMSIASDSGNEEMVAENLRLLGRLYTYIYDAELPEQVDRSNSRLGLSLTKTVYTGKIEVDGQVSSEEHPLAFLEPAIRQNFIALTRGLRTHIVERLANGGSFASGLVSAASPTQHTNIVDWADWISAEWLGRSASDNACIDYKNRAYELIDAMKLARFDFNLEDIDAAFSVTSCYIPAMDSLATVSWSGVGPVVQRDADGSYQMTDLANLAVAGFRSAQNLSYISVPTTASPTCRIPSGGWDNATLLRLQAYVHDLAAFSELLEAGASTTAERAVNAAIVQQARTRLRDVAANVVYESQLPASPIAARIEVQPVSRVERALSDASTRFGNVVLTLSRLQNSLAEQGLNDVQLNLQRCVGSYINDQFAYASALAETSRLYRLDYTDSGADSGTDVALFGLSSPADAENYVLAQVERAGVLVDYVVPFVEYMQAYRPQYVTATGLPRIWESTEQQFAQYNQNRDMASQLGLLNDFVVNILQPLTIANCHAKLRDYVLDARAIESDIFSRRRYDLFNLADRRCISSAEAGLYQQLTGVTEQFSIALENRFPFGEFEGPSASIERARNFFRDYATKRKTDETLQSALEEFGPEVAGIC